MKKIKVAHVLHAVGGVDVYLRIVLSNINYNKFECIILHGLSDNDRPYVNPSGKNIKEYKLPIYREINIRQDIKAIIETIKILKKEKPDILHAHSAKGGIIARVASLFYKVKVLHTPHAYSFLSAETKIKRKFFLTLEKLFKYTNSYLLATSMSELNQGINKVGYSKDRALLFNNSINPINKIEELSIPKVWPKNYICSVGRPSYQKNIELMLEVLNLVKKEIKEIHLVLMGVGFHSPNLESVKERIIKLDLTKNVSLLEWTKREDVFHIIDKSLLYISTAKYEGLPYSIIESLSLAKPLVATDCDGNRDLVIDNYNGFLIKNENISEMANAIVELIKNKKLNVKFSKNSKNFFNENFDISKNIYKLEKIYEEKSS